MVRNYLAGERAGWGCIRAGLPMFSIRHRPRRFLEVMVPLSGRPDHRMLQTHPPRRTLLSDYCKFRNKHMCLNKCPSPCALKFTLQTNIPFKCPPPPTGEAEGPSDDHMWNPGVLKQQTVTPFCVSVTSIQCHRIECWTIPC